MFKILIMNVSGNNQLFERKDFWCPQKDNRKTIIYSKQEWKMKTYCSQQLFNLAFVTTSYLLEWKLIYPSWYIWWNPVFMWGGSHFSLCSAKYENIAQTQNQDNVMIAGRRREGIQGEHKAPWVPLRRLSRPGMKLRSTIFPQIYNIPSTIFSLLLIFWCASSCFLINRIPF